MIAIRLFFGCLGLLFTQASVGQYYYKDLITAQQSAKERQQLENQEIRKVIVHSFEADQQPSKGFFCEKEISRDHRKHTTYIKSAETGKSIQVALYDAAGRLVSNSDSAENNVNRSTFVYNSKGLLEAIHSYNRANDEDYDDMLRESHFYEYNEQQKPIRMWRVRNNKDSLEVQFVVDEQGRVTEEIEFKVGGLHYYYYYDTKGRLTDITKYNVVRERMMPDFVFEYNSSGQVTQMTTVDEGVTNQYWVWKYTYNDGLKIIEKCYDRGRTLVGYVEYEYK